MPAEANVRIRQQTLDGIAIEKLYEDLAQAQILFGGNWLSVDCSPVTFIRPNGIMGLITAAQAWQRWSHHGIRLLGLRPTVHAYMERLDLFKHCEAILVPEGTLPKSDHLSRSTESSSLLEVTPIASDEYKNTLDVQSAIARTQKILAHHYGLQHAHLNELLTLISELAQNVIHSQDRGYIMIQRYIHGYESQVVVAISDAGIGIEQSLRASRSNESAGQRSLTNGSEFILHALQEGVTSQETSRGLGLSHIRKTVARWRGRMVIRSIASRVEILGDQVIQANNLSSIPGTQVTITAQDVFEEPS